MLSSQQNLCVLRCVWKMKPNTIWTQTPDKKPNKPGDQDGCVHRRDVVSGPRDVVTAQILWSPKLLILPLTEALQRPFSMVTNVELLLEKTWRRGWEKEEKSRLYLFSLDEIYRRTDSCCVTLNRHLNTLLLQWFSARQKASLGLDQWLNTLNTLNATAG